MESIKKLIHGKESYVVWYDDYVVKRPLPSFGEPKKMEWLARQERAKKKIDEIVSTKKPGVYNIPRIVGINRDEFAVIEERAFGGHLCCNLYRGLNRSQKYKIIYGIATFISDMNNLRQPKQLHMEKLSPDKVDEANKILYQTETFIPVVDFKYILRMQEELKSVEYDTVAFWSHGDLNQGNVMFDVTNDKLSFIDFADARYEDIYRGIASPVTVWLDIITKVYRAYKELSNNVPKSFGINDYDVDKFTKYRALSLMMKNIISECRRMLKVDESRKQESAVAICKIVKHMQQFHKQHG